jgi:predicted NACHT family NTPase
VWLGVKLIELPREFDWQKLCRRYQARAKMVVRESKELREIVDSQNIERIADAIDLQEASSSSIDLAGYAAAMLERYQKLRLESVDITGSYYRELELWRVFTPQNVRECQDYLPHVLEIPKEQRNTLKSAKKVEKKTNNLSDIQELRVRYLNQISHDVFKVVDDPDLPRIVLLGDPGCGKSSLLQALVVRWAQSPRVDLISFDLPVLVELRLYAQSRKQDGIRDFIEFLHKGPTATVHLSERWLRQRLSAGRVKIFFDGLDEVFDPVLREEVVIAVQRFSNEYPRCKVVLTSRLLGYKGEVLRNGKFRHFMIEDFDYPQIAAFIEKWHKDTYRQSEANERIEKHARLWRAVKESNSIRELAGNPLLLTMMAILNRNHDLPRDRAELYDQCSRLLLHQWKVEEALRADADLASDATAIGLKEKQTILRRVAREMHAGGQGVVANIVSHDRLQSIVEECIKGFVKGNPVSISRALIKQLRERNFILCFLGDDYYGFVHRTFLEYFCAEDFRWRFDHEKSIDIHYLKRNVYAAHWQDPKWQEILCLLCGLVHPGVAAELISDLLAQQDHTLNGDNILVAGRCLAEVRDRTSMRGVDHFAMERLKELLLSADSYRTEDRIRVRQRAVSWFAQTCYALSETRATLESLALEDPSTAIRITACTELARGWAHEPRVVKTILGSFDTLYLLDERLQLIERIDALNEMGPTPEIKAIVQRMVGVTE